MKEPGPISSAPGTSTDKNYGLHILSGITDAIDELSLRVTEIPEPKAEATTEEPPAESPPPEN